MLLIIIDQATVGKDGALVLGEVLEEQVNGLHTVLGDDLCVDFLLTIEDSLTDSRHKDHIAYFIIELRILADGERNDTPVDTIAAITLRGILVADVGIAT